MNAVCSLSRTFECAADRLYAALEDRSSWWGDGAAGAVVKADAPQRLTLRVDVGGEPTRAMLVLNGADRGTELMVMHTGFVDGDGRDQHAALWESRLERLAEQLSGP